MTATRTPQQPWSGNPLTDLSWQRHGACKTTPNPDIFTPEVETHGFDSRVAARIAKRICNGCSVKSPCRTYSVLADEERGIWGGLTRKERQALAPDLRPAA